MRGAGFCHCFTPYFSTASPVDDRSDRTFHYLFPNNTAYRHRFTQTWSTISFIRIFCHFCHHSPKPLRHKGPGHDRCPAAICHFSVISVIKEHRRRFSVYSASHCRTNVSRLYRSPVLRRIAKIFHFGPARVYNPGRRPLSRRAYRRCL